VTPTGKPPLDGIRVLDLSRWIAGPLCTMLLADMGADVIKVERPGGEDTRGLEPKIGGDGAYALHYNRNKRGITVNTRNPAGVEVLWRLVDWADVLVENYRPGTLAAMGLSYEALQKRNPRLVVASVSGFGQNGPLRNKPALNPVVEAMSGAMTLVEDSAGPRVSSNYVADHVTGLYCAYAVALALFERERAGVGQRIDLALFDAMFSVVGHSVTAVLNGAEPPVTLPNRDNATAPGNLFRVRGDAFVYIDAASDGLFRALCEAMDKPSLADDSRFTTGNARMENVDELETIIEEWTSRLSLDEVSQRLAAAGVPYGPVLGLDQVQDNPQLREREMIVEVPDSRGPDGRLRLPGVPLKLSRTPGGVWRRPPTVGEHTDQVLTEICGYTADEVAALRRAGAI